MLGVQRYVSVPVPQLYSEFAPNEFAASYVHQVPVELVPDVALSMITSPAAALGR